MFKTNYFLLAVAFTLTGLGFMACSNDSEKADQDALNAKWDNSDYLTSNSKLFCLSVNHPSTMVDLEIVDVGDEVGKITINDGGAPQHFDAFYNNNSFITVCDNNSECDGPTVTMAEQNFSYNWAKGTLTFNETTDDLICSLTDATAQITLESKTQIECTGVNEIIYTLDIVDVGDEEGRIEINDGGAPIYLDAVYHNNRFIGLNDKDDRSVTIDIVSPEFYGWTYATAELDGESETVICKGLR